MYVCMYVYQTSMYICVTGMYAACMYVQQVHVCMYVCVSDFYVYMCNMYVCSMYVCTAGTCMYVCMCIRLLCIYV